MVSHDGGDFVILKTARQAIAAQQNCVAGGKAPLKKIHVNGRLGTQSAGDQVALGMSFGLFRRKQSGAHLFLYPGVILGDLGHAASIDQVGPAVTHVRHVYFAPKDDGGYKGGSHTALGWIRPGLRVDLLVRCLHGPDQASAHIARRVGIIVLDGCLHGALTGYLACLMPAHAIGDQVDRALACLLLRVRRNVKVRKILVVWSHAAGVGTLDSYQIDLCRRRRLWRIHSLIGQWIWYDCLVVIHENLPRCLP